MSKVDWRTALCATGILSLAPAVAEDNIPMVLIPAGSSLQYKPGPASLPKGVTLGVLAGDPAKPGPFVLRVKIPANIVIAPHTHATDENLTILSGGTLPRRGSKAGQACG
jgi:hypothetical protein